MRDNMDLPAKPAVNVTPTLREALVLRPKTLAPPTWFEASVAV